MMERIKAVIVDDERAAIETLSILLDRYCQDVEVVGVAGNVNSAVEVINSVNPDVVFLDIQMPDGTGFDVLEAIPKREFEIVFVTAFNHYAVKALKYSAVEFLQKPLDKDGLIATVNKMRMTKGFLHESSKRYSILFDNLSQVLPQKLCLLGKERYEYVNIDDIECFEERDGAIYVNLENGTVLETIKSIDHFEDVLENRNFYRFTDELLVCSSKIAKLENNKVYLKSGAVIEVPASRIFEFKINKASSSY